MMIVMIMIHVVPISRLTCAGPQPASLPNSIRYLGRYGVVAPYISINPIPTLHLDDLIIVLQLAPDNKASIHPYMLSKASPAAATASRRLAQVLSSLGGTPSFSSPSRPTSPSCSSSRAKMATLGAHEKKHKVTVVGSGNWYVHLLLRH